MSNSKFQIPNASPFLTGALSSRLPNLKFTSSPAWLRSSKKTQRKLTAHLKTKRLIWSPPSLNSYWNKCWKQKKSQKKQTLGCIRSTCTEERDYLVKLLIFSTHFLFLRQTERVRSAAGTPRPSSARPSWNKTTNRHRLQDEAEKEPFPPSRLLF